MYQNNTGLKALLRSYHRTTGHFGVCYSYGAAGKTWILAKLGFVRKGMATTNWIGHRFGKNVQFRMKLYVCNTLELLFPILSV